MEKRVSVTTADLLEVIRHLDTLVVSLDRIGSATAGQSRAQEAEVLSSFVDNWDVFRRLSECRTTLSDYFSRDLGIDDMDELERELQNQQYWSSNAPRPGPGQEEDE